MVRAKGQPAEIVAYAAAAAIVLVGGAVAAGIYYALKGVETPTSPKPVES
ncbi:hypothetical protein ACLESD_45830 [Pyxidicoccus sp. 3LFB2]